MFKRIIASPRWYGFNFLIPAGGLAIGTYATGIFLPSGVVLVLVRSNVATLIGNSPASVINYGDGINPTAFGSESEPQFANGNIFPSAQTLNNTQVFIEVAGDSLVSGNCNYMVIALEAH